MKIISTKTYHFVATTDMKKKVSVFAEYMETTLSDAMKYIIEKMQPVIEYYYFFEKETSDFTYTKLEADNEIKFRIDRNIYRKLKNIQGSIHTFSVAVLVRKMVTVFFEYLEKGKLDRLFKVLRKRIKKRINKMIYRTKHWKKQHYVVHMYNEETNVGYIKCIYSKNFTLLGFEKYH